MSGKSTLLRTLGINVVLAQTINTCLASAYDAPVLRVRSLMGRADDLIAGKSYYLVEAEAVVQMLAAAADGPPHLFLFDELFRGTNTIERIAAGAAVLMQLANETGRPSPHVVIAATHDRELVDLLAGRYAPAHLSDAIGPDGLTFDYQLRPGPATTRNAIALLKLNGAPDSVATRRRGAGRRHGSVAPARRDGGRRARRSSTSAARSMCRPVDPADPATAAGWRRRRRRAGRASRRRPRGCWSRR